MQDTSLLVLCVFLLALFSGTTAAEQSVVTTNSCVHCHQDMATGFNSAHSFAANRCAACHAGDAAALREDLAHAGMIAFPGELATAERACGACHGARVAGVTNGLMHTGRGIVRVTRDVLDDEAGAAESMNLQSLGHSVADSLLRKQCASCHLGQPKTQHALDVTFDRGGGCIACHINEHPDGAHPTLSTRVDDGRCFGCHSRSGRISLSFVGLAEVDRQDDARLPSLRLADGRAVERLSADVHYTAGMGCIDCHTSVGLMGEARGADHQRQAIDIQCRDCHDNDNPQIALSDWPPLLDSMKNHVPFTARAGTRFLTTEKNATPLWQLELHNEKRLLHTKNTGRRLQVPQRDASSPGHDPAHERLTCAACHSQWAPQCIGCHMTYDEAGEQWDHIEKRITKGRWADQRWGVSNSMPALGVNADNEIAPFVPAMIMTVAHPSYEEAKFVRRFAPLSPHTIGKSRSCDSCHRSSQALGLGAGQLTNDSGGLTFSPVGELLQDGLPADAWTGIGKAPQGRAPEPGQRPFNADEMQAIFEVDLEFE